MMVERTTGFLGRGRGAIVIGMITTGLTFGSPIAAWARSDLGPTIKRAIDQGKPFVTGAEYALIRRKCGYGEGEWRGRSINSQDGVLICENGRRVDDPETRALLGRVGERVQRHVEVVMGRPDIWEAISGEAAREAREQMRRLDRAAIARAVTEDRVAVEPAELARLDLVRTELVRARVREGLDRIDFEAIQRDVDAALERSFEEAERNRKKR